jgi:hypothetical protein
MCFDLQRFGECPVVLNSSRSLERHTWECINKNIILFNLNLKKGASHTNTHELWSQRLFSTCYSTLDPSISFSTNHRLVDLTIYIDL